MAVCFYISTVINIKILTSSNQQSQSYKFTSHILSVVLITEMLEICIQTSYDQNVQLILKSYLPVMYGTTLIEVSTWTGLTVCISLSNIIKVIIWLALRNCHSIYFDKFLLLFWISSCHKYICRTFKSLTLCGNVSPPLMKLSFYIFDLAEGIIGPSFWQVNRRCYIPTLWA